MKTDPTMVNEILTKVLSQYICPLPSYLPKLTYIRNAVYHFTFLTLYNEIVEIHDFLLMYIHGYIISSCLISYFTFLKGIFKVIIYSSYPQHQ